MYAGLDVGVIVVLGVGVGLRVCKCAGVSVRYKKGINKYDTK